MLEETGAIGTMRTINFIIVAHMTLKNLKHTNNAALALEVIGRLKVALIKKEKTNMVIHARNIYYLKWGGAAIKIPTTLKQLNNAAPAEEVFHPNEINKLLLSYNLRQLIIP